MLSLKKRRQVLLDMGMAAIAAANPVAGVRRAISFDAGVLRVGPAEFANPGRVIVVGAGKAAARMARAADGALGDSLTAGLVITKYDHAEDAGRIVVREAGHPVPDEAGVSAANELLALLDGLDERDVVIVLLSGGGSCLLPSPADGLMLEDKQETTKLLLACGAGIEEINCVRKHLSRSKGGQLARLCAPANVVSLILSDVIGDPLDVIASGPTAPDPTTFADATEILRKYEILDTVPAKVRARLVDGNRGDISDTPGSDDPVFKRVTNHLIGTNRGALAAVAEQARQDGYSPRVLTSSLRGEACEVARVVCALAEGVGEDDGPTALILGGETTVKLTSDAGEGGRNQELALAAAMEIDGWDRCVLMSLGTDGTDGPTDAAGGIVDGLTVGRARDAGIPFAETLARNDAYNGLAVTGDLLKTGPTGTNVMDIVAVLVG